MERKVFTPIILLCLIPAAICFFLAFAFAFGFVGHQMLALAFAGIGTLIIFYLFLNRLALWYRNQARIITTIVSGLLFLCTGAFVLAEIQVVSSAKTDCGAPGADFLVVLGAGVNGTVPSLSLKNRLDAALDYLMENPDTIAVVSGGQGPGEDITEAQAMFDFLLYSGIDEERIIKEDKAESTEENIKFSLEKIYEAGGNESSRIAIITSEYHLYRAKMIASDMGIEPIGVAAETTMPTLKLNHFIREAIAVILIFLGVYS